MSLDERMAVLERVVEDGFKAVERGIGEVRHSVDSLETKVDEGFEKIDGRVTHLEMDHAATKAVLRTLAWFLTVPAILGGIIGLVAAIRAF